MSNDETYGKGPVNTPPEVPEGNHGEGRAAEGWAIPHRAAEPVDTSTFQVRGFAHGEPDGRCVPVYGMPGGQPGYVKFSEYIALGSEVERLRCDVGALLIEEDRLKAENAKLRADGVHVPNDLIRQVERLREDGARHVRDGIVWLKEQEALKGKPERAQKEIVALKRATGLTPADVPPLPDDFNPAYHCGRDRGIHDLCDTIWREVLGSAGPSAVFPGERADALLRTLKDYAAELTEAMAARKNLSEQLREKRSEVAELKTRLANAQSHAGSRTITLTPESRSVSQRFGLEGVAEYLAALVFGHGDRDVTGWHWRMAPTATPEMSLVPRPQYLLSIPIRWTGTQSGVLTLERD